MRIIRLGHWQFTPEEMNWLADKALVNPFAADILARYNRLYGGKLALTGRYKFRSRIQTGRTSPSEGIQAVSSD